MAERARVVRLVRELKEFSVRLQFIHKPELEDDASIQGLLAHLDDELSDVEQELRNQWTIGLDETWPTN